MRIAVMGAGAVGGYFGAKLAAAGHRVAFIARGAHLESMRLHGLQVNSPGGDLKLTDCLCTSDPAEISAVDLVLFCVKSYDTELCARSIAPMVGSETIVLSLQNGVDNPDKIAQAWSANRTRAGVVYIAAQIPRPGVIEHSAAGKIVFGTLDGRIDERTQALAQAFCSAGIPCDISTGIRRIQWTKLLWNAPFCAIACLTRATVKDILYSDPLRQLALDCMSEVRAAARTQGIKLAARAALDTLEFSRPLGAFRPSMLQDLEAGKPLEYEALNGIVVRLLSQAGKKAPVNQVLYAALKYLDATTRTTRWPQRETA